MNIITKKKWIIGIGILTAFFVVVFLFNNSYHKVYYFSNGKQVYVDTVKHGDITQPPYDAMQKIGYLGSTWSIKKSDGGGYEPFFTYTTPIMQDINLYEGLSYDIKELPIIEIYTDNEQPITSKSDYSIATFTSYTNSNKLSTSVNCKIKGHGSTSWGGYKKSYQVKFDQTESVLGLDINSEKWILVSNCFDKTLSRNAIAYALMQDFYEIKNSLDYCYVDLYINGEYLGVYMLCSKPNLLVSSNSGEGECIPFLLEMTDEGRELGSGSILNYSYIISNGRCFSIKYPDNDIDEYDGNIPASVVEIQKKIDSAFSVLINGSWNEIVDAYDVDSFATTYIIQELFANTDVGALSFYICNDNDNKISCGPVWDFDIGGGNSNYGMGLEDVCPSKDYLWANRNVFYYNLLLHPEFVDLVKYYLEKYNDAILSEIETTNPRSVSCYYNKYKESIDRNFEKYQIMGTYVWPEPEEVYILDTPYKQFEYLYNWLSSRYEYLKDYYRMQ